MDSDELGLSRRKLMTGLGTIGAAGALGGASTLAFFSDEEEFANNQLEAGSLDMKVSWEEHYSDWSPDEDDDVGDIVMYSGAPDTTGSVADLPDGYVGLPTDNAWLIAVPSGDAGQFLDNTLEEEFPEGGVNENEPICDQLQDVQDYQPAPRINLGDVKPGDFGEVTLDFALCDNPGFVWLTGGLVEAAENGLTEPEEQDDDEDGDADSTDPEDVELLDEIQTWLWYDDNCDNLLQQDPEPYCMDLIIDTSGSMEEEVYADGDPTITKAEGANTVGRGIIEGLDDVDGDDGDLGPGDSLAAVNSFANDAANLQNLTGDEADLLDAVDEAQDNTPVGDTNVVAALEAAIETLDDCPHDQRYAVLLTNDPTNDSETRADILDAAARLKGTDTGGGDVLDPGATVKVVAFDVDEGSSDEDFWQDVASDPTEVFTVQQDPEVGAPGDDDDVQAEIDAAIQGVVNQIPTGSGDEQKIFTGTLRETLNVLEEGAAGPLEEEDAIGLPLSGDIPAPDGGGGEDARNCYSADTRHCLGFAWWLPADHANEIQTDRVTFDLGFYTEQCRHNDGSGMANRET